MGAEPEKSQNIVNNFSFVQGIRSACVTVDGKDPSVLWVCQDDSLVRHWLLQLLLVPDRWEVLALDPDTVLSDYREILNRMLPRSLLPRNKNFNPVHIPYAYCTVKKKCFLNYHELTPQGFVFRGTGMVRCPAVSLPSKLIPPGNPTIPASVALFL